MLVTHRNRRVNIVAGLIARGCMLVGSNNVSTCAAWQASAAAAAVKMARAWGLSWLLVLGIYDALASGVVASLK